MKSLATILSVLSLTVASATASPAGEYDKHFPALTQLSIAVAKAMPADQYSFRPHPESMTFGELMIHIASTNFAFCAGLKDSDPPAATSPTATNRDAVVKFLSESFSYCSETIPA